MSAASYVALAVAAAGPVTVGLALDGAELQTPGYGRSAPLSWQSNGDMVAVTAHFGPFLGTARFDEAHLLDGDELVVVVPFESEAVLPPGSSWTETVSLVIAESV